MKKLTFLQGVCLFVLFFLAGCTQPEKIEKDAKKVSITNVSYDPTRELYESYNKAFQKYWQEKENQEVVVTQSHGGSGKQANSVIEGNEADVVTLALAQDIYSIEDEGLIEKGWLQAFPKNASPYTSTIVFLTRKKNPKQIKDWDDLIKPGVEVITPNPRTSGGARWNYLAAWAYADRKYKSDEKKCVDFEKKLYNNVLVLDSGARASATTFVENGQGDVLIVWENEAYLILREHSDEYEIVVPSLSIKAEPSVAVVDEVAKKRGSEKIAKGYLNYLYSEEAQRIIAENYYRPSNEKIAQEFSKQFKEMDMITIDHPLFGGWRKAQKKFFSFGGVFDQIYER